MRPSNPKSGLLGLTLLFAALALSPSAAIAASQCQGDDCGVVLVGRPKLWSLADAQYHVGRTRQHLKELRVALPNETFSDQHSKSGVIDPNAIHIRQLDIIMQSLRIDVQYDQESAIQNRQAREKFERDTRNYARGETERESLTQRIKEKSLQKARVDAELAGKVREETLLEDRIEALATRITGLEQELEGADENDPEVIAKKEQLESIERQLEENQDALHDVKREKTALETNAGVLTGEIAALNTQKSALGSPQEPTLQLTSTGPPSEPGDEAATPNPLQSLVVTKLLENDTLRDAIAGRVKDILTKDAEPHYVQQLNNFLDGHLQTIARRLTLLRQSVDPNFDLYFLEASASITPSRNNKRHIARARWIVTGGEMDWKSFAAQFVKESDFERMLAAVSAKSDVKVQIEKGLETLNRSKNFSENDKIKELAFAAIMAGCEIATSYVAEPGCTTCDKFQVWAKPLCDACAAGKVTSIDLEQLDASGRAVFEHMAPDHKAAALALGLVAAKGRLTDRAPVMPDVMPYVFEMTPSQAALNIARNQLLSKTFNFTGLFKTIIGIGGSVRYERQHETYRQFLQQQVFIAGQGKGNSEFGWDFSALPGDKWVSQGAYTAYGVLAVPKFRRSVKFSTDGSWLLNAKEGGRPQKVSSSAQGSQPNVKHEVFLPSRQDYWIEAMYYDPVPAGEEISVILQGKGFSSETSVLVNNTPLDPRWRLIDPNTSEFSYLPDGERGDGILPQSGGQKKVHGAFELMSSETIAMRFRLPGFAGIPQITLLSPHRSVHVTDLPIRVNNSFGVRLEDI